MARRPPAAPIDAATLQGVALVGWAALAGGRAKGRAGAALAAAATAAVAVPYAGAVRRHRPYESSSGGRWRWLVDTTWSAPNTLAGGLFYVVQRRRGNPDDLDRSHRSGAICLERGAMPGYATTIGVVMAGSNDRLDAHEAVHIRQARLLGPLYLPLVALDFVLATLLPFWLWGHDHETAPIDGVRAYFHRGVYRAVWHEQWAYAATAVDEKWAQQDSNL